MLFFGIGFTLTFSRPTLSAIIGFLLAPAKNGYWYLMSLSVFYLSIQVFRFIPSKRWFSDVAVAITTWLVFYFLWKYTAQKNDLFCILDCANYYPFFILGVFATKYHLIEYLRQHNIIYSLALIGYFVFMLTPVEIHSLDSFIRHIATPLCAVIVVTALFEARHGRSSMIERGLEFVGRHTLDVYVIHYFILSAINLSVVDRWMTLSGNHFFSIILSSLIALLVLACSIGIGMMLHRSTLIDMVVYGNVSALLGSEAPSPDKSGR